MNDNLDFFDAYNFILRPNNHLALDMLYGEVKDIIEDKITDEKIIDEVFEKLLNLELCDNEDFTFIFSKLYDYYKKINTEAAEDYKNMYYEFLEDDIEDETYE